MSLNFDFSSRGAVVTGGGRGIGLAIARQFIKSGGRAAIWDVDGDALEGAQRELGPLLSTSRVDVSDPLACEEAAKSLPFAPAILVNNAGILRDKSFAKMTYDEFTAVINVNLTGMFNVTKALLDQFDMNDRHRRIVNIASIVALYGNFGQTNYAAAKAGVVGLTKTLCRELGPKGFTVNAIAPGFTETEMLGAISGDLRTAMAGRVPVRRLGTVDDIANACLFLASPEAGYVNGVVLSVDGGFVC